MGQNAGQTALTVVGFAIGAYFGQPALGMTLGSLAGQALFPTELPDAFGPRIQDTGPTVSNIGAAIGQAWGTILMPPNVIWCSDLVETPNTEEQGGKGGPTQNVTTYTYTRSYALGLCKGPIAGIRRIMAGSQLLYDLSPQRDDESDADFELRIVASESFAEKMTVYLGTDDQLPDPIIEADMGTGLVPAFIGTAYIVLQDYDVTTLGGRPPPFQIEVITVGEVVEAESEDLATEVLYPWIDDSSDPRNPLNDHEYRSGGSWGTYEQALADMCAAGGSDPYVSDDGATLIENVGIIAWSKTAVGETNKVSKAYDLSPADEEILVLHFNITPQTYVAGLDTTGSGCALQLDLFNNQSGTWKHWGGLDTSGAAVGSRFCGVYYGRCTGGEAGGAPPGFPDNFLGAAGTCVNGCNGGLSNFVTYHRRDARMEVRRKVQAPPNPCSAEGALALPESADYCVIGGEVERDLDYTPVSGTFKVLQTYGLEAGDITRYPLGPVLALGDPNYNNQAFWEAAHAADPLAVAGTYGVDYPVVVSDVYTRSWAHDTLVADEVTVGDIVQDVCEQCGLESTEFDVSELTEVITGYRAIQVMSGRAVIEPLRQFAFFDGVESEGKIKFPVRGADEVGTLTDDDLGAHIPGSERPPTVSVEIGQASELPKAGRVHYLDEDFDYQPNQQDAGRLITDVVNAADWDLRPIAMDATKAAEIAQVSTYEPWISREKAKVFLSPEWMVLDPGDALLIPVNGENVRYRVESMDLPVPFGPIPVELSRDEASVYSPYASGVTPTADTDTISVRGPTEMVIIDGPALNSDGNDAGFYVASRGLLDGWAGTGIYESTDGGSTWHLKATSYYAATMGQVVSAIDSGPTTIWDRATEITVDLDSGSLESVSETAVLNGSNAAFVGAAGRWEVVQFTTATYVGEVDGRQRYTLSGLLRGRKGTEFAVGQSEADDYFVLIGTGVLRVSQEPSAVGMDRQYKAVTLTTTIQAAEEQDFTGTGAALKPYSPANVEVQNIDGTLIVTWNRRTRISGEWLNGSDVLLNEETEAYRVTAYDVTDVVLFTEDVTTTTCDLAGIDPDEVDRITVAQISAVVGAGYEAEVTDIDTTLITT